MAEAVLGIAEPHQDWGGLFGDAAGILGAMSLSNDDLDKDLNSASSI